MTARRIAMAILLLVLGVAGLAGAAMTAPTAGADPYDESQYFSVEIKNSPDVVWEGYANTFQVTITDKAGDSRKMKDIYISALSPGASCTNTLFPDALVNRAHTMTCTVPAQPAGSDNQFSISVNANIVRSFWGTVVKWGDSVTADKWTGWESKGLDVAIGAPQTVGYIGGEDIVLPLTVTNSGTIAVDQVELDTDYNDCDFALGTMQPGQSTTRVCTIHTNVNTNSFQFVADAQGRVNTPVSPGSVSPWTNDADDVWIDMTQPNMGVSVSMTDDQPGGWLAMGPITTDISVINTSNVAARMNINTIGLACDQVVDVAVGATFTFPCTRYSATSTYTASVAVTATPAGLTGFGLPSATAVDSEEFVVHRVDITIEDLRTNPAALTIPVRITMQNRTGFHLWQTSLSTGYGQCDLPAQTLTAYNTVTVDCTIIAGTNFTMTANALQGGQITGTDTQTFNVGPTKPRDVISATR